MFELPPPPPSWDGFHPLVVHFPIALLAVAPIFVLLGALSGIRSLMVSALILLLLGVAGAFAASSSGEEAMAVADPNYDLETEEAPWEVDPYELVEKHGEDSEFARNVFAGITAVYAVVVLLAFVKPSSTKFAPRILTGLVLVAALGLANLLLANAAHMGGELVHIYGVRAAIIDPNAEAQEAEEEDAEEMEEEADEEQPAETAEQDSATADESEAEATGGDGESAEEDSSEEAPAEEETPSELAETPAA